MSVTEAEAMLGSELPEAVCNIQLSICVPTYNRCEKLERQLIFLRSELIGQTGVEVIVSDNCSPDKTPEVMSQFVDVFQLHRNNQNVGLVGNLLVLLEKARGRHVWFVGDDDALRPGILKKVRALLRSDPEFVFLNHDIVDDVSFKMLSPSFLPPGPELYKNGKSGIKALVAVSLAQAVLISASIYKRSTILELPRPDLKDLAIPLRYAFYCSSRGHAVIGREVLLTNYWGDTSWEELASSFKVRWIPNVVKELPAYGYGALYSYVLLWSWYRRTWREYLRDKSPRLWGALQAIKKLVVRAS